MANPCTSPGRAIQIEDLDDAVYTSGHPLEKGPKKSHFVSLFGPPCVAWRCRGSIRKSFHVKQIRLTHGLPGGAEHHVGRRTQKSHIKVLLLFTVSGRNPHPESA